MSDNVRISSLLADIIEQMKMQKSSGRTERDRYVAISVTELEKVLALWLTFVENNKE
jgi:hypothetical protein